MSDLPQEQLDSHFLSEIGLRKTHLLGADRSAVIMLITLCAVPNFQTFNKFTFVFCVLVWIICLWALRQAYKHDPDLKDCMIRHIFNYKRNYKARSTPFCVCNRNYSKR